MTNIFKIITETLNAMSKGYSDYKKQGKKINKYNVRRKIKFNDEM